MERGWTREWSGIRGCRLADSPGSLRRPAPEPLPAVDELAVPRIDLEAMAAPAHPLGGHEDGARTEEGVAYELACPLVVANGDLRQQHRLLGRVVEPGLVGSMGVTTSRASA